jgi:hypothetical protein
LLGLLRGLILLHGLLLLLLHRLLLGVLLSLLLLLLDLRHRLSVVVIVAAANQRQTGGADPGPGRGAQNSAPAHSLSTHPLPIGTLAHRFLLYLASAPACGSASIAQRYIRNAVT